MCIVKCAGVYVKDYIRLSLVVLFCATALGREKSPLLSNIPAAEAKTEQEMRPYTEKLHGSDVKFDMVPIPGGEYVIGSPDREPGRAADEGPQRRIKLEPFWMGKCEVTWDEYDLWHLHRDFKQHQLLLPFAVINETFTRGDRHCKRLIRGRVENKSAVTARDQQADAVSRPSLPYMDMTFGMGHDGYPAICMTQLAAKTYCQWLSAKTGHYYRLPTEAEWEYACRAGTTTAYSFGDDPARLSEFAWYRSNSKEQYQNVGKKKPNPWGLHDMHGNVMEWTLDQYVPNAYSKLPADQPSLKPLVPSTKLYPHVARGGSWDDEPIQLRSAARAKSDPQWKYQDPQTPKSRWHHTDAIFVGFRVVRPQVEDSVEDKARYKGTADDLNEK